MRATAAERQRDVVFAFPGQGAQWVGMADELMNSSPIFADRMRECARAIDPLVDWSLLDAVRSGELDRVDVVQPALFAMMASLAAIWESLGIAPDAVVGHSQGEIAAACVAGALSLEDSAKVVVARSKALRVLSGHGGMLSVSLPAEEVRDLVGQWTGVSLAAINGPASTVVAGHPAALDEVAEYCAARNVRTRRVPVDYASHSAQVEQVRAELSTELAGITWHEAEIPFYSAVTGGLLDTATLDPDYWYDNLRRTVEFEQATRTLLADGHGIFIEVSPHPVLTFALRETVDATGAEALTIGSIRRDDGGMPRLLASLGELYALGAEVDWAPVFAAHAARLTDLPTYPFARERYWLEDSGQATADVTAAGLAQAGHPLLGAVVAVADSGGRVVHRPGVGREPAVAGGSCRRRNNSLPWYGFPRTRDPRG
ncbi:acyltransferase domain-containing protein [Kibdelosporangium aridum]|uniref:acyltransferase domain-containing protein n=1 Tax=Kibdelosporangium aridum TaxID=2030 RepID=UPI00406BCF56